MSRPYGAIKAIEHVHRETAKPAPSEMDNVKATTEQLRVEASINRKKVSEVSTELLEFCEKNKAADTLVSGPGQHNPFQEKKNCNLL